MQDTKTKSTLTGTVLTYETLVNLSEDEFTRVVLNTRGLKPTDILVMITRLENDVLIKIQVKDGEKSERYQFYKRILSIMYMAMQAEEHINFWRDATIRFKMEAEFHKESAGRWFNQLSEYKTVEKLVLNGDLDKYIEQVKERNKK